MLAARGAICRSIHPSSRCPRFWVDNGRLSIALGNLLDNAVKYSPEGSKIIVRGRVDFLKAHVSSARFEAEVEIENQGPMLSDAEIERPSLPKASVGDGPPRGVSRAPDWGSGRRAKSPAPTGAI